MSSCQISLSNVFQKKEKKHKEIQENTCRTVGEVTGMTSRSDPNNE